MVIPVGSRKNEMKIVFLEEEIKELKHALRETRNKNQYLIQLLEQSEEQRKRQYVFISYIIIGNVSKSRHLGTPGKPIDVYLSQQILQDVDAFLVRK